MNKSINDLIRAALHASDDEDVADPVATEATPVEKVAFPKATGTGEFEKLAAALDFIGRRGVSSFLTKEAEHPGHGNIGTDAGSRPGGNAKAVDLGSMGTGTSHPALASNQAAIDVKGNVKAKHESPQLAKALSATPFADPEVKKNLVHAAEGGDPNINKTASTHVHDPALVQAALAKKLAGRDVTPAGRQ